MRAALFARASRVVAGCCKGLRTQGPWRTAWLSVGLLLGGLVGSAQADDLGVRVRFGLNDEKPSKWDGTVEVSEGRVTHITGWRFTAQDTIDGTRGWKTQTRPVATFGRGNNQQKAADGAARRRNVGPLADNGVVLSLADVTPAAKVTLKFPQGVVEFALGDLRYGEVLEKLDGAVEIERAAAAAPLTTAPSDDDYPAIATGPDGATHVAYVSFTHGDRSEYGRLENPDDTNPSFANSGRGWKQAPEKFDFLANPVGGDRVWLRTQRDGQWAEPLAVTDGGGDIYKCAVAVDGAGRVWVVWSENVAYPGPEANFEILARPVDKGVPGEVVNLSQSPGSDLNPAVTTDGSGRVWLAWQGVRDGAFRIMHRRQTDAGWSPAATASTQQRNCWTPAVAASADGRVAIAWDTYEYGDYDVWVREYSTSDGAAREPLAAANTVDYEARPALTYDRQGRLWVAYELGSPSWGKDSGPYDNGGNPLYRGRQIGLIVREGDAWVEPSGDLYAALPNVQPRKRVTNLRVPPIEPQGESPEQARTAELERNLAYNNLARIACDAQNRVWILCRARQNDFRVPLLGSLWLSWAVYLDGDRWVGPVLVPHSDNLLYNTPSVAPAAGGGLVIAHSSDHRQDRFPKGTYDPEAVGPSDPFDNDVFVTRLAAVGDGPAKLALRPARFAPQPDKQAVADTEAERAAVARCRAQSIEVSGRTLRLIRGEYHRHTEISGDGGNDGPLEDMWRYALDVSAMDWLGCGDHDNGAGREYTWWLTQKTTDAFRIPGAFEPPFTYERSVRYPEGHRNVMFVQRGVRTLPRLPITERDFTGQAPDTQMLYRYLHQFHGVCAVHTSATSMGTDWRDNDPVVEPMVEIYQGDRQNYERPGAPRSPTADYSIGGWEPKGFVNLALLKGYRLSFQCSSDHLSTHISYALAYAENNSREALVQAIRERHIYGATDNIVADFRSEAGGREYMLGDEFTTADPPAFRLHLVGTAPFARVTLVKDDVEIPLPCDSQTEVKLTWTDPAPVAGKTSYYYVRGEQQDGELVWVSPMWVKYQPRAEAE